jgi:hypothetical protein
MAAMCRSAIAWDYEKGKLSLSDDAARGAHRPAHRKSSKLVSPSSREWISQRPHEKDFRDQGSATLAGNNCCMQENTAHSDF